MPRWFLSMLNFAAVDGQRLAVDAARVVAQDKADKLGNLTRVKHAILRAERRQLLLGAGFVELGLGSDIAQRLLEHLGAHIAGTDGVERDDFLCKLASQRARGAQQAATPSCSVASFCAQTFLRS